MTHLRIHSNLANYHSDFGDAKKEDIYDLGGDRLSKQIFAMDGERLDKLTDEASSMLTTEGMGRRMTRDMMIDRRNSRQEISKSKVDIKEINRIPNLEPQQPDTSVPGDYRPSNAEKLYQGALINARNQANMYTDPKAMENKNLSGGGGGNTVHGMSRDAIFRLSAGGLDNDRLTTDEDGAYMNVVSNSEGSAF